MAFELGGKKKGISPSMNVTPLVDVVLVLLIIFMVVTPLLTKQMYMAVPPKPDEKTPPQKVENPVPPLVLTLGTDLIPRVNNEVIPRKELRERLMRMLNARAEKVVFFDARDEVPYEEALSLIDFVRGGGVKTVAVLADKVAE
jgi:biopolymer transport protein ExbD